MIIVHSGRGIVAEWAPGHRFGGEAGGLGGRVHFS